MGLIWGSRSSPTFSDMNGDGDHDLAVDRQEGTLNYFENMSSSFLFFSKMTGISNPLMGLM